VDALLKGLDTGDVETDKESAETYSGCEPYDWNTQGRNLKGNMPILTVVNGRLAREFRQALSASLRRSIEVMALKPEIIKFEEFQRALSVPTSLHLFRMAPLRGIGMLVLENRLVFNLLEAYFGGSGTDTTNVEGRDFTPIEQRIIMKVVSMAMTNFKAAWEDMGGCLPDHARIPSIGE
jgi:flagellar motor switch protein FliM